MPYKIIETKERGKLHLSIIPEKWEENNVLYWPKRKVEALLDQEDSCPGDSWLAMKCRLKRNGLISKKSAEAELSKMLEESDTETEGNVVKYQNIDAIQQSFDEIAESCLLDESVAPPLNITGSEIMSENVVYVTNMPQSEQAATLEALNVNYQSTEIIPSILAICGELQQNQIAIMDSLKNMEDKILRKLSYLSAQFDTFAESASKPINVLESFNFKKLCGKDDLINFDKQLENPKVREYVKNQLSVICGKGKGRGLSNAYSLADAMFSRRLMTECSWAGGSKTGNSKLCFKFYTRVIDLFFEIIYESDNNFTRKECEVFLKNILRHSMSRNKENIQRASSSKRRPTKNPALKEHINKNSFTTNNTIEQVTEDLANNQPVDLSAVIDELV